MWVVGSAAVPAKNLKELIAWLKENPGKATVGIGGVGGGADVVGTYFQKNTGTRFQFVPYRGAAPIIQDSLAGHIDLTFTQVASALAQVRSGQLKAYVVMAKNRWAAAPDTPTIDEEGVPGLYASFWHGLWAPKGTPKDVIAKLDAAVVEAFWPIRPCSSGSSRSVRKPGRATSRRRRRSPRSRRPKSKSGGRSSRLPA